MQDPFYTPHAPPRAGPPSSGLASPSGQEPPSGSGRWIWRSTDEAMSSPAMSPLPDGQRTMVSTLPATGGPQIAQAPQRPATLPPRGSLHSSVPSLPLPPMGGAGATEAGPWVPSMPRSQSAMPNLPPSAGSLQAGPQVPSMPRSQSAMPNLPPTASSLQAGSWWPGSPHAQGSVGTVPPGAGVPQAGSWRPGPPHTQGSVQTLPPSAGVPQEPGFSVPKAFKRPLRLSAVESVMCLGFVVAIFMVCLPVVGGIVLLNDTTYSFWAGHRFPLQLIFTGIGTLLLLGVTLVALIACAVEEAFSARLLSSLAASFSSLLGVLLVFFSISASSQLHSVAGTVGAMGCGSSMPEIVQLMDYSVVLYNLRMTPSCFRTKTVESCQGWHSNEYTRYLRYLEREFDCGPICQEASAPQVPPPEFSRIGLLHTGRASRGSLRQHSLALQPAENIDSGDIVRLSDNETYVREAFKALLNYSWNEAMADMLGREFRVMKPAHAGVVGLPSPDGGQGGVWYFPTGALELAPQKAQAPPAPVVLMASLRLFSHGRTSMTCLPIIATRLKVLAFSFGDLLFWQGLLQLVLGIFCACLGLSCGFDRPSASKS
uniref:Uncharacterized protein n=1 Tax=Alexandrium monilatum TaxID=311494 RepID=A0A7S4R3N8_9DINO